MSNYKAGISNSMRILATLKEVVGRLIVTISEADP